MKIVVLIALMTLAGFGCKHPVAKVVLLDYSYNSGWITSYSVKIYSDGHGFLKKNNLRTDSFFVADKINLDSINTLINQLQATKINSTYDDYYLQDGSNFYALILHDKKYLQYYVYGYKHPELLTKLENVIRKISELKVWEPLNDTAINFKSYERVKVPKMKIDTSMKFLPPSKMP